ncbi:hypothetical protein H2O64_05570 [Kordia sp. YSTF-M3]|uniref:Uncharacterized protein n=1 Tax=Kordia aestuariivivens TaxID=2759037 RepID=A0ABR7Q6E1_9FLAO|nr:hypothetical protein [Kordia aestuariivivens]MBC8754130.1 hypothetical protein [Kordia aestuariivivens]
MREESEIKNVCNKFIEGRVAFDKGDASMLKQITTDSLFLIIELNEEYAKLLGAGGATRIREDIRNIRIRNANIEGDCAICTTSLGDYYMINLCKDNEQWKVKGENYSYPTVGQINRTKDKIEKQKKFLLEKPAVDSVLKVVNSFHKAVKTYFLTEDLTILSKTCDAATFKIVKDIYRYTKKENKLKDLKEEIKFPKALAVDCLFEKEKVACKFYDEETYLNLRKINNNYTVTGLNKIDSDKITQNTIKEQYLDLLRTLYLLRTKKYWNKMKFMANSR